MLMLSKMKREVVGVRHLTVGMCGCRCKSRLRWFENSLFVSADANVAEILCVAVGVSDRKLIVELFGCRCKSRFSARQLTAIMFGVAVWLVVSMRGTFFLIHYQYLNYGWNNKPKTLVKQKAENRTEPKPLCKWITDHLTYWEPTQKGIPS